jgi:CubicO group peptidase (beta-lactamase class C family)
MNRKTAGIVFMMALELLRWPDCKCTKFTGSAALDTSLREAVERKDVPGVVALVTDRERVLYQSAFGVADVATGRRLRQTRCFALPR